MENTPDTLPENENVEATEVEETETTPEGGEGEPTEEADGVAPEGDQEEDFDDEDGDAE